MFVKYLLAFAVSVVVSYFLCLWTQSIGVGEFPGWLMALGFNIWFCSNVLKVAV